MENSLTLSRQGATPPSPLSGSKLALQVLAALSECLPRQHGQQPLTPEAMEFMAEGLSDLPAEALRLAVRKARNACKFMPTVAELREWAGAASGKAEDAARAEELAAWSEAIAWLTRYRSRLVNPRTGMMGWSDPAHVNAYWRKRPERPIPDLPARVIEAVNAAGGPNTVYLSSLSAEDGPWAQKRFCEAYRLADSLQDARKLLQVAPGATDGIADGLAGHLSLGEGV